ncbi:MAG: LPS export ABC transporter periplasmic protein LptC [Rhodoferax sp.]|nr:LPS export ABC transporter periplasmic protein LptC [Rhodoferax sp.]
MKPLLPALWDRFLLSLPLALMLVLALGSYWLVRTTPQTPAPAPAPVVGHTPDYFMKEFSIKSFDSTGRLHAEVTGAEARHYADTQWTEIDAIALKSVDDTGRLSRASAARGLTNEDASEVQLLGQALIVREAKVTSANRTDQRLEFRGEFLHVFVKQEVVRSHLPVELRHGAHRFTADALDYDNVTQVAQLTGRVHATLAPANAGP